MVHARVAHEELAVHVDGDTAVPDQEGADVPLQRAVEVADGKADVLGVGHGSGAGGEIEEGLLPVGMNYRVVPRHCGIHPDADPGEDHLLAGDDVTGAPGPLDRHDQVALGPPLRPDRPEPGVAGPPEDLVGEVAGEELRQAGIEGCSRQQGAHGGAGRAGRGRAGEAEFQRHAVGVPVPERVAVLWRRAADHLGDGRPSVQ